MGLYCFLAVITTMVAYMHQRNKKRNPRSVKWLVVTILILATFSSIRYGIGVDYNNYVSLFHRINLGQVTHTEWGFNFIVRYMMQAGISVYWIFALFAWITITTFIMAYNEQSKAFAISVLFFIIMGFYFYTFNSIRYYFALAVSLYAYRYFDEKKYKKYLLLILLGSLMHKSILAAIPLHILCRWKLSSRKQCVTRIIECNLLGAVLLLGKKYIRKFIFLFYPTYENSVYDTNEISVLNVIISVTIITFMILMFKQYGKDSQTYRHHFNAMCVAQMLYTYCMYIPTISRIGYYLMITAPIAIADIIVHGKNKAEKTILTYILVSGFFIAFIYVMYSTYYKTNLRLLPYETVFGRK